MQYGGNLKAEVTIMHVANAGVTILQIKVRFEWTKDSTVSLYSKSKDSKRLLPRSDNKATKRLGIDTKQIKRIKELKISNPIYESLILLKMAERKRFELSRAF
ncbi:hypothetical protein [Bartonella heixiaziensis]|uniref:hypothetical protein n=1 Tax=Bartonella heixiaziensis TaxID=1461000 RepID=UPI003D249AAB